MSKLPASQRVAWITRDQAWDPSRHAAALSSLEFFDSPRIDCSDADSDDSDAPSDVSTGYETNEIWEKLNRRQTKWEAPELPHDSLETAPLMVKLVPLEQFYEPPFEESIGIMMFEGMMSMGNPGYEDFNVPCDESLRPPALDAFDVDEFDADSDDEVSIFGGRFKCMMEGRKYLVNMAARFQTKSLLGPQVLTPCDLEEAILRNVVLLREKLKCHEQQRILILDIQLRYVRPCIWRRVRIPAKLPLAGLHDKVIAPAFGWRRNYHSYLFTLGSWAYPSGKKLPPEHDIGFGPDPNGYVTVLEEKLSKGTASGQATAHAGFPWPVDMMHMTTHRGGSHVIDASKISVGDLLHEGGEYLNYVYDLGDIWRHVITLSSVEHVARNDATGLPNIVIGGSGQTPPEDSGGLDRHAERLAGVRQDGKLPPKWDPCAFDLLAADAAVRKAFYHKLSAADDANMTYQSEPFMQVPGPCGERKFLDPQYVRVRICDHCGAAKGTQMCERCKNVHYCNRECQKAAWRIHRQVCCRRSSVQRVCDHCHSAEGAKMCERCKSAYYCGRECQRAAWRVHRKFCYGHIAAHQTKSQNQCSLEH
eukprot:TRINITY_DN78986_c0_g1_i1.p1 TRINITY_DN78986_c0_g1~~TRINITY_DN78986_c0_g1_i1.p1  ORF type:complete len:590 (+),score=65.91 TRINITY_DN78986_c0_g1_i1:70-1839(+)